MALTDEQIMQMQSALNPSIQLALPQTVVPVTKTSSETRGVRYDPAKLQALKMALGAGRGDLQPLKAAITAPRPVMSNGEAIARALAQYPEAKSYTGGFGEEIINPWAVGLSSLARGFGNVYGARAESQREADAQARDDAIKAAELDYKAAEMARDDAIKMAQLENDAAKQEYVNQVADDWIKYNNPTAKNTGEEAKQVKDLQTVQVLMDQLEDIGTRFDDDFKNIDDIQANATKFGTATRNALWGVGRSTKEKQGQEDFEAWKGSVKNVLVNANKQAGSGSMSDADAARYEQEIGTTKDPAQARNIMRSFVTRLTAPMAFSQPKQTAEQIAADNFMRGNL